MFVVLEVFFMPSSMKRDYLPLCARALNKLYEPLSFPATLLFITVPTNIKLYFVIIILLLYFILTDDEFKLQKRSKIFSAILILINLQHIKEPSRDSLDWTILMKNVSFCPVLHLTFNHKLLQLNYYDLR